MDLEELFVVLSKVSDEELKHEEYSAPEEEAVSDNRRAVSKMFKTLDSHISSLKESK